MKMILPPMIPAHGNAVSCWILTKPLVARAGEPTFRYSLIDGVNDPDGPFLVNPTVVDARTEITTQLLADEGYAVINHGERGGRRRRRNLFRPRF
jgi:type I restriction enzyme R subunit